MGEGIVTLRATSASTETASNNPTKISATPFMLRERHPWGSGLQSNRLLADARKSLRAAPLKEGYSIYTLRNNIFTPRCFGNATSPIRALVPSDDERAAALRVMGAEVAGPTSPAPE